ncbi:M50 family metallopeptidase [Thermodesulfobacteriota bacterium]
MVSIQFFAWILLILLLSTFLNALWRWSLPHLWLLVALWPGVVIHEMSHAVACLITGAKIHEIKFFKAGGGYVIHEPSRIPVLGRIAISLAPLVGCTAALITAHHFLGAPFRLRLDIEVPAALAWPSLVVLGGEVARSVAHAWDALLGADFAAPRTWGFLYALLSVCISLSPSRADLNHASIALGILFGIFFLVEVFGFSILETRWGTKGMDAVLEVLSMCGSALVTAIAASLPLAIIVKLLRKST